MLQAPGRTVQGTARILYPRLLGQPRLLRAAGVTHRFPRHTHDGYAVGVVDAGALGFRYRGEEVVAPSGSINLVVPDVAHTGHPAETSWSYRMFYLRPSFMEQAHRSARGKGAGLPQFRPGVVLDDSLARRLVELHRRAYAGDASVLWLESELVSIVGAFIERHSTRIADRRRSRAQPATLDRARDLLHARFTEAVSLAQLAAVTGTSPWHLNRRFAQAFGVPPHAYQIQLRVREAVCQIRKGERLADIATATGFADQSHLSRHFKQLTGMTPGQYRKNLLE